MASQPPARRLFSRLLPFVRTVERKTYDWRIQWTANPASARHDIVLVAIDQSSVRNLEPLVGRWPWPRMVHASLLDYLARGPAKVVVYDVIFAERDRRSFKVGDDTWTGEESDRALAEATANAGNVVHVVDVAAEAGGAAQEPLEATPTGSTTASRRALSYALRSPTWRRPAARSATTSSSATQTARYAAPSRSSGAGASSCRRCRSQPRSSLEACRRPR